MKTYNLVNSVKGGCGKTTFSIWLAYYLNMLSEEKYEAALSKKYTTVEVEKIALDSEIKQEIVESKRSKEKAAVELAKCRAELDATVLIDMDLLGTSMQVLFNGNSNPCKTSVTNDIFYGVKNSKKNFVEKIRLQNGTCINVIFSSMDYTEKEKFKSGRYAGYTPVVKHSIFRSGLRELIQYITKIDDKDVKHFIFDMPPNSDGFSDAAMECIFDKKYTVIDKNDRKNLFMMIGSDWGQTIATIAELEMLLVRSDEIMPDGIFLVINHNLGGDFSDDCYNIRKSEIENMLNKSKLTEEEKNRIFFLKMFVNKKYTELGIGAEIGGIGLRNAEREIISDAMPKAVITAVAQCGKAFEEVVDDYDGQKKLLKLILGEDK